VSSTKLRIHHPFSIMMALKATVKYFVYFDGF
jgi:hypothetical protein